MTRVQAPEKTGKTGEAGTEGAWCVYVLACADGALYCGITTNMERRLAQHNGTLAGGARCTRARRPVRLVQCVACADRSCASKLEAKVKRAPRDQKIAVLIAGL